MENENNVPVPFQRRRFSVSDWEKGLLAGVVIGGILGPSICLLILALFISYDLYADKAIYYASGYLSNRAGNSTNNAQEIKDSENIPQIKAKAEIEEIIEEELPAKIAPSHKSPLQVPVYQSPSQQSSPITFRPSINIPLPNFGFGSSNSQKF